MATAAIEVVRIAKSFHTNRPVLKDVSFTVNRGEMVALIGPSGSGKSTLIRAIAGLITVDRAERSRDRPPGGCVRVIGESMQADGRIAPSARRLRARVGVIFQQFNLVPRLTVLTNVCLGLLGHIPGWRGTLARFSTRERRRAMQALARVGIAEHALKRASELSGGQQQRAAIARTLVQGASVLIADEPIASLDPEAARRVMDILAQLSRDHGITVLVSLHQVEYALSYCPRSIALRDGRIAYDGPSGALDAAFLRELYGAEGEELLLPTRADASEHDLHTGHLAGNAGFGKVSWSHTQGGRRRTGVA